MNLRIFLYFSLIAGLIIACKVPNQIDTRSPLVQQLEEIFYADDFINIPPTLFKVQDYGAIGDSVTLNTSAIQKAIDAAHDAGGGKVVFAPGIYLSGAIFLKSNVNLHLDEGVTLRAVQDDKHYPRVPSRIAGFEMEWLSALVNVYDQKNVMISGAGTIDGNGKFWWDKFWGDPPRSGGMWTSYKERNIRWAVDYDCERVRALVIYKSQDVAVRDVDILRSGFWTVSLTYSQRVHVDGITIKNNIGGFGPSSDGINTDSSSEILVENCDIDCNDDNLCIKAGRDADGLRVNRPSENIVYRNCITRAGHGLFTIGSETSGGMRNIEVYGLEAEGTTTGIRFKSAQVRGGLIENIYFHDIKMTDVNKPFHFELNWYPEYSYPQIPKEIPESEISDRWRMMTTKVIPAERGIPEFRNLTFENISAEGADMAIYANAYPDKKIHHLSWDNVSIQADKGGSITYGADWDMHDVSISLPVGQKIVLKGSPNIALDSQLVQVISASTDDTREAKIRKKVDTFAKQNPLQHIIPFNVADETIISARDTTIFSEEMVVYIDPTTAYEIKYIEPLGDGFYTTPVDLSYDKQGDMIEVKGQKSHQWTFYVQASTAPQKVHGADEWHYDKNSKSVVISKECASCKISLK